MKQTVVSVVSSHGTVEMLPKKHENKIHIKI